MAINSIHFESFLITETQVHAHQPSIFNPVSLLWLLTLSLKPAGSLHHRSGLRNAKMLGKAMETGKTTSVSPYMHARAHTHTHTHIQALLREWSVPWSQLDSILLNPLESKSTERSSSFSQFPPRPGREPALGHVSRISCLGCIREDTQ